MSKGVKLVFLALLALAAAYVVLSRGRSVPRGSYIDAERGFSLVSPSGWHLLPPQLFGRAAAINPALRASLSDEQIALVLIGPEAVGRGASSIHVAVVPGAYPELDRSDPEAAAQPLERDIQRAFGSFAPAAARRRNVDGLAAVELSGALSLRAGRERAWLAQTLVPGHRRYFLLTFLAAEQDRVRDEPAYEAVLSSFRVLRRPSPF